MDLATLFFANGLSVEALVLATRIDGLAGGPGSLLEHLMAG